MVGIAAILQPVDEVPHPTDGKRRAVVCHLSVEEKQYLKAGSY
jgi:hypothetical protein